MPERTGWSLDPQLPPLPLETPCCDLCGRRFVDMLDNGSLPKHHREPNRHVRCPRDRDDLLSLVYRLQRDAAGLGEPQNPWGFRWIQRGEYRALVATSTPSP